MGERGNNAEITFAAVFCRGRRIVAGGLSLEAQDYPTRAITIVVPASPGGAIDTVARLVGQKLSETWGQPVVVDNKPGASNTLGTAFVAKAAPDGYTLVIRRFQPCGALQLVFKKLTSIRSRISSRSPSPTSCR